LLSEPTIPVQAVVANDWIFFWDENVVAVDEVAVGAVFAASKIRCARPKFLGATVTNAIEKHAINSGKHNDNDIGSKALDIFPSLAV